MDSSDDENRSIDSSPVMSDYDTDEFDTGYDTQIFFPPSASVTSLVESDQRSFLTESMSLISTSGIKPRFSFNRRSPYIRTGNPYADKDPYRKVYNFLAASLVRRRSDIAVLAVYLRDGAQVYYTKNILEVEDIRHAEDVAGCLMKAARERMKYHEFAEMYYELILRNCHEYVVDLFKEIEGALETVAEDNGKTLLAKLLESLEKSSSSTKGIKVDDAIDNEKEKDANEEEDGSQEFKDPDLERASALKALHRLSCITNPSVTDLRNISLHAEWILKSLSLSWIGFLFQPLLPTLDLLSKFSKGMRKVHAALFRTKTHKYWQNITLHKVDPAPSTCQSLCTDVFYVLQCLYFHQNGEHLQLSRDQFNEQNPRLSLPTTQSLSISPELRLISHLASLGRHPTTIGMSRLSCGFCASQIHLLNKEPSMSHKYWNIKGTRDIIICQPMECAQDVEKAYIYSHALRILHLTKRNIRSQWKDKNGKRHIYDWGEFELLLEEDVDGKGEEDETPIC
jgi:hypothetical protein